MSTTGATRRLAPAARRDQIASTATEHAARNGLASLSMSAVAAEAGITRGLLYRYFPDRETLVAEVLRRESERLIEALAPIPGLTVRANLESHLRTYVEHFAATFDRLQDPAQTPTDVAARLAAHVRGVQVDRLTDLVDQPDQPGTAARLHAWLALVEDLAREAGPEPGVDASTIARWGIDALAALFPVGLDFDRVISRE